jgi:organic radical activating enzyme
MKDFPEILYIDVTNHCNKRCSFCPMKDRYYSKKWPLGFMDFGLYKELIDECVENVPEGMQIELHKDGEPLLHPQIGQFIEYAKERGCHVHFATNGILLGKKKEEIVGSGLDLLTVSAIDDIPVESIREFMDYKGDMDPVLQVKYFDKKPDVPADRFIKRPVHNWTDDLKRVSRKPCSKLLDSAAVTWDGFYQICCVDYKRESAVKLTTIGEMFNKENLSMYEKQCAGVFEPPCCHCNYWRD